MYAGFLTWAHWKVNYMMVNFIFEVDPDRRVPDIRIGIIFNIFGMIFFPNKLTI
jgi:hypothetical protein